MRRLRRVSEPPKTAPCSGKHLDGALELFDWIDNTEADHLRAGDIMDMTKGQKLDVTFFDRNVADNVFPFRGWRPKKCQRYPADVFLKNAMRGVFTSDGKGGLTGTIRWFSEQLPGVQPFKFEVLNTKDRMWHPDNKVKSRHCSVGWRGPAIRTSLLKSLPDMVDRT